MLSSCAWLSSFKHQGHMLNIMMPGQGFPGSRHQTDRAAIWATLELKILHQARHGLLCPDVEPCPCPWFMLSLPQAGGLSEEDLVTRIWIAYPQVRTDRCASLLAASPLCQETNKHLSGSLLMCLRWSRNWTLRRPRTEHEHVLLACTQANIRH